MTDSEILPIREALTKLDELSSGAVPEATWLKLTELEDVTYKLWARYVVNEINTRSTSDEHRKLIREHLKELSKKDVS